jgi:predicted phosphoribosyltransferase
VGEFYEDFRQTTDEEVVDALQRAWARTQVS